MNLNFRMKKKSVSQSQLNVLSAKINTQKTISGRAESLAIDVNPGNTKAWMIPIQGVLPTSKVFASINAISASGGVPIINAAVAGTDEIMVSVYVIGATLIADLKIDYLIII